MTETLTLTPGLFLAPTPAGALHAVTTAGPAPADRLVRALLREPVAVRTDDADLHALTGLTDPDAAVAAVAAAQDAGWLEGQTDPPTVPTGPLGTELPALLAPLSDQGQAALVDDQGFSLGSIGFTPEAEMELSILAAEVVRIQQRRTTDAAVTAAVTGWGLVDRHGATTVAIYPLLLGSQQFVLIVGGLPRLHHPALVTLIGALSRRYDPTIEGIDDDAPSPAQPTTPVSTTPGGTSHA